MHRRPSSAASPLTVLPLPPRSREVSSLMSPDSAPHTPTKRDEPLPFFSVNTTRNSSSSWNSSNCDGGNEMEFDWKPEQIRLLVRTLDALPSHLLTPFNGPVPPSNLLDKLARGVAKVKTPVDWPHSLRATRAKIVELARRRTRNVRDESASDTIVEEESDSSDVPLQQTTNIGLKRPLYRQSSMDFMQPAKPDLKDNSNIPRLSRRLQRAERILISQPYDRYAQSPSLRGTPSLNPSTPSSTTLNSDTPGSRPSRLLRRSISSLSNTSDQYQMPVINPSVQRLKRSDTFGGSTLYPTGLKRAPSYGGSSRNSMESVAMSIDFNARDSDVTSSDEEEKLRSQKAKRARRKITSPTPTSPPMSSPMPISPVKPILRSKVVPMTPSDAVKGAQTGKSGKTMQTRLLKPKANLQRNPSILGPELPNPQPNLEPPATIRSSRTTRTPRTLPDTPSRMSVSPPDNRSTVPASPYNLTHIPSISPQSSRTLRRSRAIAPLPRAPLARKISFGSLAAPVEQGRAGSGTGLGLASAFQLH